VFTKQKESSKYTDKIAKKLALKESNLFWDVCFLIFAVLKKYQIYDIMI